MNAPASRRTLLRALYDEAVEAAQPAHCLAPHWPEPPKGRIVLLAGGKAAGRMAKAAEDHFIGRLGLGPDRFNGLAVTRTGYGVPTERIEIVEAAHPVPDAIGVAATQRILALASAAGPDDLVLALLSGGASANWIAPLGALTLSDKQAVTRALLRSGAGIGAMNTLRKHLSAIKGGRLALAARPAPLVTLGISDVPYDDPSVIGSGPTVPDPSTQADALAIVRDYGITLPDAAAALLADPAQESPKPGDPAFADTTYRVVASPALSLAVVAHKARAAGYELINLGAEVAGEARLVAQEHAALARDCHAAGRKVAILSGGELTVTIKGHGRGGPNQEYALALAMALDGTPGIEAIAGDTDGTDGGGGHADDPAGAYIDPTTRARGLAAGRNPVIDLDNNDSTGFFEAVGDLLSPGPTGTNVNDLRAILVDP